jgi:CubicO group peptidase (beta-lactamase class C family)
VTVASDFTSLVDYYPHWVDYRRWYGRVPGVQVAVRHGGELVASFARGRSDLDTRAELRTDHLFRIASHSKSVAAVIVLQLVEQGRVRLDDPVSLHLPELEGTKLADRTLGELLSHGGGVIRDSEDGDFWQGMKAFPDRDELFAVARDDSSAVIERNEHFKYSNIGYGLLGMVIETVTGEAFADRVRSAVAERLGLRDLGGEYEPARQSDYAAGHTSLATARHRSTIDHVDTHALAAATGCYATAADLTAFFDALMPGDERLLRFTSSRLQKRRSWEAREGERWYGLGLFLDKIGDTELFGHTGGYPGHITCTLADADDRRVVSVFTNCLDGPATPIARGWYLLQNLARKAAHAPAGDDARRFTGRFGREWGLTDVVLLDGRLFAVDPAADDPADDAVPLEIIDATTLRIAGGRGGNSYGEKMRYTFAGDGVVQTVRGESGMSMAPFATPSDQDGDS